MTEETRRELERFVEMQERANRQFVDHLLRNFRGEVDVISGKLDRLRERLELLEGERSAPHDG